MEGERHSFSNTQMASDNIENAEEDITAAPDSETEDLPVASNTCAENGHKRKDSDLNTASTVKMTDKRFRKDKNVVELLKQRQDERAHYIKCIEKIIEPDTEDEIDLFFKTMVATVKKFDQEIKTEAKVKIFNLVTEMEIRNQRSARSVETLSTFNYNSSRPSSSSSYNTYFSPVGISAPLPGASHPVQLQSNLDLSDNSGFNEWNV